MKKEVRIWIEAKGFLPAVFRALSLWDYSTEEQARQQLVKVIESGNHVPGPYILQYAITRRKREVQWPFLYIPLAAHLCSSIFLIAMGLSSQKPWQLCVSVIIAACVLFIFRHTWFSKCSEACRFIYLAGDSLSKESLKPNEAEKEHAPQNPQIEIQGQLMVSPAEELGLELPCDASREVPKGAIATFLLHELILKECNRKNIYDGDAHKTTLYYSHISGCKQKNILSRMKHYRSRYSIDLSTPNARSTHRRYLEILLEHYSEIGDDGLYKQAGNLQAFIENAANWKRQ